MHLDPFKAFLPFFVSFHHKVLFVKTRGEGDL